MMREVDVTDNNIKSILKLRPKKINNRKDMEEAVKSKEEIGVEL